MVLWFFMLGSLIHTETISEIEKRKLASFPELSVQNLSGKFQTELEDYLKDHILFRQQLLMLNSFYHTALLLQKIDNGIILEDGYLFEIEQRLDQKSIDYAVGLFESIYEKYLENTDCKIFFSIIPDKNYFLGSQWLIDFDYDYFFSDLISKMDFAEYIDLRKAFDLSDFYYGDPHIKQEEMFEAASVLASALDIELDQPVTINSTNELFVGSTALKTQLSENEEKLNYIDADWVEALKLYTYTSGMPEEVSLYDFSSNQYDFFLQGTQGLLLLENPDASSERELIIFRDSFSSALSVWLAQSYQKIWLVDLKNISSIVLSRFIDFKDQDVLFLYSTTVLNNSYEMR